MTAGTGLPTAPAAGSSSPSGAAGSTASSAGTQPAGSAATAGTVAVAAAGAGGASMQPPAAGMGAAASGAAGADAHEGGMHDDCVSGQLADPTDAMTTSSPDQWKASNGDIDLVLPKTVLTWMKSRVWEPSHDAWHNVRRCRSGFAIPGAGGTTALCTTHPELVAKNAECSNAEDGYQFLVMHRHMMQSLRQAFPKNAALFSGFPAFPFDAKDVPVEWQNRWGTGWASNIKSTAMTLENIEKNLGMFATEGDLGKYIQCGGGANGASSIHGALHFKWVVNESPYSLGKQTVNIDNFMFWKLHGWIDQIWERYRVAKGLAPTEPKLAQALTDQCREMHRLGAAIDPKQVTPPTTGPLPAEKGVFHEQVRPIFEKTCSSCHSESSPEAGMALGGQITSANVVKGLVNVTAMHGGQFKRVVPGDPDRSWLYLKIAGMAAAAGCMGAMCNAQVMPPAGQVTVSQADLTKVRQWIMDGAVAPTQ
ncbi:MAG TPA: hypothetical protein VJV78_30395 [Polyangiales bacterium]|nr:hypothetical protein [Polyangiales bacterium]